MTWVRLVLWILLIGAVVKLLFRIFSDEEVDE